MKLSENLKSVFEEVGEEFTIGDIVSRVEGRSFALLFILLSLPIALPFTPPGFTVPFGSVLVILACQLIAGRKTPWLPQRVLVRKIRAGKTARMIHALPRFLARFERFLSPRWSWVYLRPSVLGIGVLIASVAMMVPLPVTNTICSVSVLLIGLGMIAEDGVFGLAGLALSVISAAVVAAALAALVFGAARLGSPFAAP